MHKDCRTDGAGCPDCGLGPCLYDPEEQELFPIPTDKGMEADVSDLKTRMETYLLNKHEEVVAENARLQSQLTEARRTLQDIAEITGSGDRDAEVCDYVHSKATHALAKIEKGG